MTDYSLDGGQWEALREQITDGVQGEDFALACNAAREEHVHVRRVGEAGSRLGGRVVVSTHGQPGAVPIFLAAPEARMLAAAILDAADDLDGVTPLVYMPPGPDGYAAHDEIATPEPEPASVAPAPTLVESILGALTRVARRLS